MFTYPRHRGWTRHFFRQGMGEGAQLHDIQNTVPQNITAMKIKTPKYLLFFIFAQLFQHLTKINTLFNLDYWDIKPYKLSFKKFKHSRPKISKISKITNPKLTLWGMSLYWRLCAIAVLSNSKVRIVILMFTVNNGFIRERWALVFYFLNVCDLW